MQCFVRRIHNSSFQLKNLSKIINNSKKTPELKGASTIYNAKSSASNYKGYMRAKVPAGLYFNRAPSSPTGSINSETIPSSFLPSNDPRKQLVQEIASKDVLSKPDAPPVLPSRSSLQGKSYHLNPEQIEQIRRLRLEDPAKNTRKSLASQYNVSPLFISMVSEPPKEWKQEMDSRLTTIKSKWHVKRVTAREDRKRRKELWYRS
ncbi:ZYRO0A11792p [Zygosaccharomyces rouxii]|uniref:ZYRO0A11792p n=1 Tax=Zygosaccharomyces rouxii (strain ATCC 2623 / CBS 732 / NBRC 1130 / NCYC 568 / NRRL Y-229) TaxID=559307 RepID=C5DNV4_ZYGRC|nr:mitochondrial 54S ribosomal protein YmL20 [Zygosaccharomyces rouxii]KAH9198531.1 mitochondrial 54S ribosomal protein YmL20 [Zygosaccharomyces rouxii]CAR25945.1 ZYRO0A11792p [Zygosaccharomyces rouxii]